MSYEEQNIKNPLWVMIEFGLTLTQLQATLYSYKWST